MEGVDRNKRRPTSPSRSRARRQVVFAVLVLLAVVGAVIVVISWLPFNRSDIRARTTLPTRTAAAPVTTAPFLSGEPTGLARENQIPEPRQAPPETTSPSNSEPSTNLATPLAERVAYVMATAPPEERDAAEHIMRFALNGHLSEVADIDHAVVQSLARRVIDLVPPNEIAQRLHAAIGIPPESYLAKDKPDEALVDLFDAVTGRTGVTTIGGHLVFTDRCEADGRITGSRDVIPRGTHRVYAVFENAGNFKGLERVLAVWRDPNDKKMVFTESEPLHPEADYNHVWLEVDKGWPAGRYQLELYHPEVTTKRLASQTFRVD